MSAHTPVLDQEMMEDIRNHKVLDLDAIQSRLDAANRPWFIYEGDDPFSRGEDETPFAAYYTGGKGKADFWVTCLGDSRAEADADARFILHAHDDLTAALKEIRELRTDKDQLVQSLNQLRASHAALLEAAEAALAWIGKVDDWEGTADDPPYMELKQAIAQAKGGEVG